MADNARPVDEAVAALRKSGMSAGQVWRGPSGATFRVTFVGVAMPSCDPMVGYAGTDGIGRLYHLAMFMGRAKRGNVLVPRFVLCEE